MVLDPAFQLPGNKLMDEHHACLAIIEARNAGKILTPIAKENFAAFDVDFIERLEAICGKTWCHDHKALGTLVGEALDLGCRIRLQPFRRPEARLKANRTAVGTELQLFAEQPPCFETLIVIRIALRNCRFRQAMKGNQNVVRNEIQARDSMGTRV
jgi:hypothetical protein